MADLKFLNHILQKDNQYKTLLESVKEGLLPFQIFFFLKQISKSFFVFGKSQKFVQGLP